MGEQGYLVSDDEIEIPFDEFKAQHGNSGAVEYVSLFWFSSTVLMILIAGHKCPLRMIMVVRRSGYTYISAGRRALARRQSRRMCSLLFR